MFEELDIFGVYMPAALAWAVLAGVLAHLLRNFFHGTPMPQLLWQPGLLDLALFALLWWSIARLADAFLPGWLGS
jgi:protein AaeX